jgi:hypothetical protein
MCLPDGKGPQASGGGSNAKHADVRCVRVQWAQDKGWSADKTQSNPKISDVPATGTEVTMFQSAGTRKGTWKWWGGASIEGWKRVQPNPTDRHEGEIREPNP